MAGSLLPQPKQIAFDNAFNPGIAYQFYTYDVGTLTPKATYQDAAMTIANTNPVIANGRGEVVMYGAGAYRLILKDALGNTIWDQDNIESPSSIVSAVSSALAAAGGSALVGFQQAGASTFRTVQDKLRDNISVRDFGAKGDGTTDDTAAFQAAINYVVANGGTLNIPKGDWRVGDLVANMSALAQDADLTRICIRGAGRGNTQLRYIGTTGTCLYLLGSSNGDGIQGYFTLEGFRIQGSGQLGAGLKLEKAANFHVRDVTALHFRYGLIGIDLLVGRFDKCSFINNAYGVTCQRGTFSQPNAITFSDCEISGNDNYGALISQPTTVKLVGGSIEYNGKTGSDANKFGLQFICNASGQALQGALAGSVDSVYFEGNKGQADVWITTGGDPNGVLITGCTFNRIDPANFVVNNIRLDASAGAKFGMAMIANGFRGFGTYVASADNKYVAINSSGASVDLADISNTYFASVETPLLDKPATATAGHRIALNWTPTGIVPIVDGVTTTRLWNTEQLDPLHVDGIGFDISYDFGGAKTRGDTAAIPGRAGTWMVMYWLSGNIYVCRRVS